MASKPGRREREAKRLAKEALLRHAFPSRPQPEPLRPIVPMLAYASLGKMLDRFERRPDKMQGVPTNRWERGNRHKVPSRWRESEVWWQKRAVNV